MRHRSIRDLADDEGEQAGDAEDQQGRQQAHEQPRARGLLGGRGRGGCGGGRRRAFDLGPQLGIGFHRALNLNDGLYGNNKSWISGTADTVAPFGGVKQSGLGREGSHFGMDDYVEIKYLCLGDILK